MHIMHEAYHTYGLGMSYAQSTFSASINTTDIPSACPTAAEHTGPVTVIVSASGSVLSGVKGERVEGGTRMQAGVWKWRTGWGGGVRPDIHVDYDVVMDTRIQPWRRGGGEKRERDTWYLTGFWNLIFFTCQWGIMIE